MLIVTWMHTLAVGIASVLETLVSQYAERNQWELVAHYFHQSIMVYLVLMVPFGYIMFKCDSLLALIEEDP